MGGDTIYSHLVKQILGCKVNCDGSVQEERGTFGEASFIIRSASDALTAVDGVRIFDMIVNDRTACGIGGVDLRHTDIENITYLFGGRLLDSY